MSEYKVQQGDTLSAIALEFYGDAQADKPLAKFNNISDPHAIKAGDVIRIPKKVVGFKSIKERTHIRSIVDTHIANLGYPIIFRYKINGKYLTAARRHIYCWYKDPDQGWQNIGILMTDDWGCPYHLESMVQSQYSGRTVEVTTKKLGEKNNTEPLAFGFYTAKIANDFEFADKYNPVHFIPGSEFAFMPAPLDTIQAADSPASDIRGFDRPPEYKSNQQFDVYQLESQGRAVRLELPKPRDIEEPVQLLQGSKILDVDAQAIIIDLPLPLTEYVSLIKKYTQYLDDSLAIDFEAKKEYFKICSLLNESAYVLELMRKHPKQNNLDKDEKAKIYLYQRNLEVFTRHIEDHFLKSTTIYKTKTHIQSETVSGIGTLRRAPDIYEKYTISDFAQQLFDLFQDQEFNAKLTAYCDLLKTHDFDPPDKDFFSFKHAFITLLEALHDACLAISMIPDEKLVQKFYEQQIRPWEAACVKAFDELPESDDLKMKAADIFDGLNHLIGKQNTALIQKLLNEKTEPEDDQPSNALSALKTFWQIISHPRATAFWNNQDGTPSMMTRIRTAYAKYRNVQILANPKLSLVRSVYQVKLYLIDVRYYALARNIMLENVTEYVVTVTKSRTTLRYEIETDKLRVVERFAQAHKYLNFTASSIQLVAAVAGIIEFVRTEEPQFKDYVNLVDCVSNGGLAVSGLAPRQWQKMFGTAPVTTMGKMLAGVGFFCTLYTASLEASYHAEYGEDFLTTLSCIKAVFALVGGLAYLTAAIAGCGVSGPIGWIVFAGILLVEIITFVYKKAQPGTYNFFHGTIPALDEMPLMHKRYSKFFEKHCITANGPAMGRNQYHLFGRTRHKIFYEVQFPPLLDMRISNDMSFTRSRMGGVLNWAYAKDHSGTAAVFWDSVIKDLDLPFEPLDYQKTIPMLLRRGWKGDALKDLHSDGWFEGAGGALRTLAIIPGTIAGEITDVKRLKETIAQAQSQIHNQTPQKANQAYANALMGNKTK